MNTIKIWLRQIRANFLVLPVALVAIGVSSADFAGKFNLKLSLLTLIGTVLSHISVNLFNEYSDFKTAIDSRTNRTPFSGGSGNLQMGLTSPRSVLLCATTTLLIAFLIGIYLCLQSGWLLLIFILCGGFASISYTSHLSHILLGEMAAGLCLGTFVVLGTFYVLTQSLPLNIIFLSISPGILTFLLLLLNEFPDAEADAIGGRNHIVIHFGREKASKIYVCGIILNYLVIISSVLFHFAPPTILIALLSLPFAFKAGQIAIKSHSDNKALIPALGFNVIVVLSTNFLIAIGFLLAKL